MDFVNNLVNKVKKIITSKLWLGFIWVSLGLATAYSSPTADLFNVLGPIVVGAAAVVQTKFGNKVYYILGFAAVLDRVIGYLAAGIWNPLFVWLLVLTYAHTANPPLAQPSKKD
jgi:hypothetical protein